MPHIRVVIASYNGARYLAAQLDSLAAQDHKDWSLLVSDDGSQDATEAVVAAFRAAHPAHEVLWTQGPAQGSAANFLSAIAAPRPAGSFLAISDQDDIWMTDHLSRALLCLAAPDADCQTLPATGGNSAAIYASRTILIDGAGAQIRASVRHPRGPSAGNALVQNILAGNTMVLSPAAADLAAASAGSARAAGVAHHDWWLYLLVAAHGGQVVHDTRPSLYYRQHGGNVMGAHQSLGAVQNRWQLLRDGSYRRWITANLTALDGAGIALTPQAATQVAALRAALASPRPALRALARLGIRRQSWRGDLMLALALVRPRRRSLPPPATPQERLP